MKFAATNDRGFRAGLLAPYIGGEGIDRVVTESSKIGPYDDSIDNPGSSYLWIGADHHLDREEAKELADAIYHWLDQKRLP